MLGSSLAVLAIATGLILNALRDSIVFFTTPTMAAERHITAGKRFRLGGLVQPGSLARVDSLAATFSIADGGGSIPVSFRGPSPICSGKVKASLPKVPWTGPGCFAPTLFWRSTTKTTCPGR